MRLLLLTTDPQPSSVLPGLAGLPHRLYTAHPELAAVFDIGPGEVVIVDARVDLSAARALCKLIDSSGIAQPVAAVFTEGGLVAVSTEWELDEFLLPTASPAELDARLRLLPPFHRGSEPPGAIPRTRPLVLGNLIIDEDAHTAYLHSTPLALTYLEFALLAQLAHSPGRVFTRAGLLEQVWGPDTAAGPRTVDVYIRRLRAKLGPQHQHLLGTVRNIGYTLIRPAQHHDTSTETAGAGQGDTPTRGESGGVRG